MFKHKKFNSSLAIMLAVTFMFNFNFALATSTEEPDPVSIVESITLEGEGSVIEWTVDGTSAKGFKVVWSKNEHPTYPTRSGDKYHYYSSPTKDRDELTAFSGNGTYYVRVCEYLGGACGVYSNEITVVLGDGIECAGEGEMTSGAVSPEYAYNCCSGLEEYNIHPEGWDGGGLLCYNPEKGTPVCRLNGTEKEGWYYSETGEKIKLDDCNKEANGDVKSISLRAEGTKVIWDVDGTSAKGFKVVWSKNENPTYPTRDGDKYHYFSDPNYFYDKTLTAFSGNGTYYVRVCEYLGGACGVYSNQVEVNLDNEPAACTMEYAPVCGKNGKTYSNKCVLNAAGIDKAHYGECKKDDGIIKIEESAGKLSNNQLDDILAELQELRNLVKEQQSQIRHLSKLLIGVAAVTEGMQNSINSFIAYGVDDNTKRLGEGERAAVMYSFKNAFGKLPEDEEDLSDAIKIANGRWPGQKSENAEERARERFAYVYKREPNSESIQDNAAIVIMSYGLRQRAENRNLESERKGLGIYKDIFHKMPETTDEWNTLQAITYSGATR